jgi:hypothetical protein
MASLTLQSAPKATAAEPLATARWVNDRDHLLLCYADWRKYRARWLPRFQVLAPLLGLLGIVLLITSAQWTVLGLLCLASAAILALRCFKHRDLWMRQAAKGRRMGRHIRIEFHAPGFTFWSDEEGVSMPYAEVQDFQVGPGSMRLWVQGMAGSSFLVLDQSWNAPGDKSRSIALLQRRAAPGNPACLDVEPC